jgi:hypothetical protein
VLQLIIQYIERKDLYNRIQGKEVFEQLPPREKKALFYTKKAFTKPKE